MLAQVVTPYTRESDGSYWPLVCMAYEIAGGDQTGQRGDQILPQPNAYTVEVVCDAATLSVIKADSRFVVLWEEDDVQLTS